MGASVSPKQRWLSEQAIEILFLEKRAKKLSVATKLAEQAVCLLFALQLCLVNLYIMIHVADDVVYNVLMEAAFMQKLTGFFGNLLSANVFAIILYAVLFLFGVPLVGGVLTKWVVYFVANPKTYTDIKAPTASGLLESTKKIITVLQGFPEGTLGARFWWVIPCYACTAIPLIKAVVNCGEGSGYVTEEILAIIIWLALIYLPLGLLGIVMAIPVQLIVGDGKLGSAAAQIQKQLEKQKPSSRSRETKKSAPATSSKPASESSSIVHHDSFTWTASYVRENEKKCSDTTLNALEVGKEFLEEGNMAAAFNAFAHVVKGLELLMECDRQYYLPPLYANAYAASRVAAFGTKNMAEAEKYARLAVKYTKEGASFSDVARRDGEVISDYLSELEARGSDLWDVFGAEFPYDIING